MSQYSGKNYSCNNTKNYIFIPHTYKKNMNTLLKITYLHTRLMKKQNNNNNSHPLNRLIKR